MHLRLARILIFGLLAPLGGLLAPFGLAIVGATPGFAQFSTGAGAPGGGMEGAGKKSLRRAKQDVTPQVAPPPVLPGTKSASEPAAPTVSAADMSPTDGLFDAINRGDLAAARDAVNRGANLAGHNVLGLTPLELSVDLGRNDISFMLLSMRGEDPTMHRSARRGVDQRIADAPRAVSRARVAAAPATAPDERVVATPRLHSGNGGAPIPAAGFLGFDEGRSVR